VSLHRLFARCKCRVASEEGCGTPTYPDNNCMRSFLESTCTETVGTSPGVTRHVTPTWLVGPLQRQVTWVSSCRCQ
jgi:hypothetical protein